MLATARRKDAQSQSRAAKIVSQSVLALFLVATGQAIVPDRSSAQVVELKTETLQGNDPSPPQSDPMSDDALPAPFGGVATEPSGAFAKDPPGASSQEVVGDFENSAGSLPNEVRPALPTRRPFQSFGRRSLGVTAGSFSAAPSMMGDFFGGPIAFVFDRPNATLPPQSARPAAGPGVGTRRVKIAENFSAEVRDRCYFNYSFFNDAQGGLGDVSRYVLGYERILVEDLISLELRLPLAGTHASTQDLDAAQRRDLELGNMALISKGVLLRSDSIVWSGGLGVTFPFADDSVIRDGGQTILNVRNRAVHLLPFTGVLTRPGKDTTLQGNLQLDVATNGDPVFGNTGGGDLSKLGVFSDSTLFHCDVALNHTLHRDRHHEWLRAVIANAELHYAGTLQESDVVVGNGLTYTNLQRHFNVVNVTLGCHLLVGDHLVLTPGMSLPLRSGGDEQFDYEAMFQLNYLH